MESVEEQHYTLVEDMVEYFISLECPDDLIQTFRNMVEHIMPDHIYSKSDYMVTTAFNYLRPNATDEELEQAKLLACIFRLFQHSHLMFDDFMDNDSLRFGKETWSKLNEHNAPIVTSDFLLLDSGIFYVLEKRFAHLGETYSQLVGILRQIRVKTYFSNKIEAMQAASLKKGASHLVDRFTLMDYEFNSRIKTTIHFELVAFLAMTLAGYLKNENQELYKKVAEITGKIGIWGQINDDMFDVFTRNLEIDETETDIRRGQFNVLFLIAKQHCRSEQEWNELKAKYGKDDDECVKWVRNLMVELDVPKRTQAYITKLQKDIWNSISTEIGLDTGVGKMLKMQQQWVEKMCLLNEQMVDNK